MRKSRNYCTIPVKRLYRLFYRILSMIVTENSHLCSRPDHPPCKDTLNCHKRVRGQALCPVKSLVCLLIAVQVRENIRPEEVQKEVFWPGHERLVEGSQSFPVGSQRLLLPPLFL